MVSILIPTYNYNILPLIVKLIEETELLPFKTEIIVIDDASTVLKNSNSDFSLFKNVVFIQLKKNIGRSRIRNRLSEISKFDHLIFLDCDTLPSEPHFILNYYNALKENKVIFGGLAYKPNNDTKYSLRYLYGIKREAVSFNERLKKKTKHFTTANFAIKKEVFNSIKFDENHDNYGHEDTLFSIELLNKGYVIKQINNPVYHLQLDTNKEYLNKIESSSRNLFVYYNLNKINSEDVKFIKYYEFIGKLHLKFIVAFVFKITTPLLFKNLLSGNPKLYVFDFYRFGYLCTLNKKND
ncbi:glycosyltransferase family 2 protein [Formosa sp. PL04]|uniref:glycosyltransferase family 2 protein n=1 Tax=Formosa sp. PL04 TaxID=3081755 RepID=UPI0029811EC9|nr:glycosyltransferase [Formosa sp. PL04]MDW5288837.1 glycosyltransferase [Formosa sp. PL04]